MRSKMLNKPVSVRLTDKQYEQIKNLSRKLSYEKKQDITSLDLIRRAINELLEREAK